MSHDPAPLLRHGRVHTLARSLTASDANVASTLGVSRETVARWRHGQRCYTATADACAIRLGFHPSEVWPDTW